MRRPRRKRYALRGCKGNRRLRSWRSVGRRPRQPFENAIQPGKAFIMLVKTPGPDFDQLGKPAFVERHFLLHSGQASRFLKSGIPLGQHLNVYEKLRLLLDEELNRSVQFFRCHISV